jgi:hypothetical protein
MQYRRLAVLGAAVLAGCSGSFTRARAPSAPTLVAIPAATGSLPALCRRPVHDFAAGRALLDSIAGALATTGTPPGPYTVVRLPRSGRPQLASFAMHGDTAVIAIGDTVGGHSLYHELVHAWAARLAPGAARAMVESVFAADRIADWEPEVARWASASYLAVINGLAAPNGFTTMALSVTAGALDTAHAGRLTRLFDATAPIVARARGRGDGTHTIGDALDAIARAHWRYAGRQQPRGWDGAAERRFILASEVLAYARERACLAG